MSGQRKLWQEEMHDHYIPSEIRKDVRNIFFENHEEHDFVKVKKRAWSKFDVVNNAHWTVIVPERYDSAVALMKQDKDGLNGVLYDIHDNNVKGILLTMKNEVNGVMESGWYAINVSGGKLALYDTGLYALDK